MIGRWIDSLSDEERDRIVTAMDWRPGAVIYDDGARCLLGHVRDVRRADVSFWSDGGYGGHRYGSMCGVPAEEVATIGQSFDRLYLRVGIDRAVLLVKARAGASISLPLPESAREASGVVHG